MSKVGISTGIAFRALAGTAALFAVSTATYAADLPVKAKAVEYVRVCSLYGAGFYYIPGTDTCIKLGGYLRAETAIHSGGFYNGSYASVSAADNRLTNYYQMRARENVNIDTRTATEYGVVRTFFDANFTWSSGSYVGNSGGNGSTYYSTGSAGTSGSPLTSVNGLSNDGIAGGSLGLNYAFIQFAGFTMGRAVSQFDAPWNNYPGNNFDQLVGGSGSTTGANQFTYTADFGQGVTASVSAQDQALYSTTNLWNTSLSSASGIVGGSYGGNSFGGLVAPDVVGMIRADQAWGLIQASVALHDNHAGYYGATETSGHPGDKWGWAGSLALSLRNIPTGPGDTINVQGVYTNGASRYNFASLAPTQFAMYGSSSNPLAYQSLGFAGVSDAVYSTGSDMQLTSTYGMRGAFTHNWNPYWNTAVYGAWAAVRYNGTAKSMICGSPGMLAVSTASFTCNPDFNISQIGVITRWTPVKNLTFSADVVYSHLDQKYSGLMSAGAANGVAKPAGFYEAKDQDTVSMLLRAQRNF
jgi:Porin subfamily